MLYAKKFGVLKSLLLLLLCLTVFSRAALAVADWEWTQNKGWSQTVGRALPNPAEQLKYAYKLEKEGKYLSASQQYFLLLKAYPDSEEAGVGLQRLANCLFLMENYYDAYKALEQVIKSYPFSAEKSDLIKIEFLIGRKFQSGARVDLLDDNENPVVGKRAAIEIFESVVANDPVGPYSGASLLAIASCYKDLDEPARGIVYADRVLTEFSMSGELVAKARILKKTMEVMQGDADINSVRTAVSEAKKAAADADENPGDADLAPVDDYDSEIRELEEIQAKKLWDSAEFYKKRGTKESMEAYKFSLEQIVVRFPNTSYASKSRRIIGTINIPEKSEDSGGFNIPFISKKPATFVTAANSDDYVHTDNVPVPGIDSDIPDENQPAALPLPKGREEIPMGEEYAAKGSKPASTAVSAAKNDATQGGGFDNNEELSFTEEETTTDFVDPTAGGADSVKEEVKTVAVTERVSTEPVPSAGASAAPAAPIGLGASAVPVAAASASRYPQQNSAGQAAAADDPFARNVQAPTYDVAPDNIKNETSASAVPVSMRSSASIVDEAESSARVKANEAAAENNDWSFSEEF